MLTSTINQETWFDALEGEITIIKSNPSQSSIPSFNGLLLVGAISVVSTIIIRYLKKLGNRSFSE